MTLGLLFITDGRDDYHASALASAQENLPNPDVFIHVDDRTHDLGFAGAIRQGWRSAVEQGVTHLIHLEGDFTFNQPPPVHDMIAALDAHPHLVQLALLRQPWNAHEHRAGGIIQQHPDSYTPVEWAGHHWFEHARFFTTNPCVIPQRVFERAWPACEQSEGIFGLRLYSEDPARRAGFWGRGEEWVRHIGAERAGVGY